MCCHIFCQQISEEATGKRWPAHPPREALSASAALTSLVQVAVVPVVAHTCRDFRMMPVSDAGWEVSRALSLLLSRQAPRQHYRNHCAGCSVFWCPSQVACATWRSAEELQCRCRVQQLCLELLVLYKCSLLLQGRGSIMGVADWWTQGVAPFCFVQSVIFHAYHQVWQNSRSGV